MVLSILNYLPINLLPPLEAPRWILTFVCLAGIFLACVTDEGYSLLCEDEFNPKTIVSDSRCAALQLSSLVSLVELPLAKLLAVPRFLLGCFLRCFHFFAVRQTFDRLKFYLRCRQAYQQSTSKRHFLYLMQKFTLDLPWRKGETEIDSYLDCKDFMREVDRWPFMWKVDRVKDRAIQCEGVECVPMSSYSYLNFMRDVRVQQSAIEAAQHWSSGNHGPRMLGGNTAILCQLEEVVSKFFGREDTLICAAGYLACMSACAAICTESTVVFVDARIHASLSSGLKLGAGKLVWFRHNDFKDLRRKVQQHRRKYLDAWLVLESVYSMDGDICDLPQARSLGKEFNIKLLIDEAHGLGILGKTGRGVEEHFNMRGCADLIVGTFSKSIASIGGYITGSRRFISYLDFHALGNCFSAPLPAYCVGAALRSFALIDEEPGVVAQAQAMARLLRAELETGGGNWPQDFPVALKYEVEGDPDTTVIPVVFPKDQDRAVRVCRALQTRGYMCSAVTYPACPLLKPRMRITATAALTPEVIHGFVKALVETCVTEPAGKSTRMNW